MVISAPDNHFLIPLSFSHHLRSALTLGDAYHQPHSPRQRRRLTSCDGRSLHLELDADAPQSTTPGRVARSAYDWGAVQLLGRSPLTSPLPTPLRPRLGVPTHGCPSHRWLRLGWNLFRSNIGGWVGPRPVQGRLATDSAFVVVVTRHILTRSLPASAALRRRGATHGTMGSMANPPPASMTDAAEMPGHAPESEDASYLREVLGQPEGITEADIDQLLFAKAIALGIEVPEPRPTSPLIREKLDTSGTGSTATVGSHSHMRRASTISNGTESSGIPATPTSPTSPIYDGRPGLSRRRPRSIVFTSYDRYISQIDPNLNQPKFVHPPSLKPTERAASIFSIHSKKSIKEFKRSIASKLRKRKAFPSSADTVSCVCCREEYMKDSASLETLPCGHTYCHECLSIMVKQSMAEESKMPPRCCTQPIPSSIIKVVLSRDEQQSFLRAVVQYSTPWETRIFCPNATCNEFIPPRSRIDPKHPFQVVCKHCKTRVCVMCKRRSHRLGQDCPEDWELDAVLKMGERSGWRRCYKCRTLVELAQGCTHMTCRCKAQFCYICGGVWDTVVGCPNFCNGEEELERRRQEEEARLLELEAEEEAKKAAAAAEEAERQEAEKRTEDNKACKALQRQQETEMARFRTFERKMRWVMWARHSQKKLALMERYSDLADKMRERHAKTEQHLEDRQVEAEIELRANLEQSERSIRIQLKYMEAYCNGLGRFTDSQMPSREVTQKHLEQLGQQYHIRDGMERRHQSQINVLREKQAKRMEELMERQEKEREALDDKKDKETEDLAVEFSNEEEALLHIFEDRKTNLIRRWELTSKILCQELEKLHEKRYLPIPLPEWPLEEDGSDDSPTTTALPAVAEEDVADE